MLPGVLQPPRNLEMEVRWRASARAAGQRVAYMKLTWAAVEQSDLALNTSLASGGQQGSRKVH